MEHNFIIITSDNRIDDNPPPHGILSKYLSTFAGKQALATSMIAPLRRRVDYQNVARQIFSIQPLPAPPAYLVSRGGDEDT